MGRHEVLDGAEYVDPAMTVDEAADRERTRSRDLAAVDGVLPAGPGPGLEVPISIEVVWGPIGAVEADVVAVGHYEGVYPTAAELSVDEAISGGHGDQPHLLHVATARGALRGSLGDVFIVPSRRAGDRRTAAVLGLGRPGTFQGPQHEVLVRNMVWTAEQLLDARTLACVLIGAGAGNLSVDDAVDSLVRALDVAVSEGELTGTLRRIRLVELELGRARAIHSALARVMAGRVEAAAARITLLDELTADIGGTVSAATALGAVVEAAATAGPASLRAWIERGEGDASIVEAMLDAIAAQAGAEYVVSERVPPVQRGVPTRLSVLVHDGTLVASAVSDAATVPERSFGVSPSLFLQLVEMANAQAVGDPGTAGRMLLRVAVPAEFRPLLDQDRDVVVEVDRTTASLPWEILGSDSPAAVRLRPLGLRTALARQLRTRHSPRPVVTGRVVLERALIIGDPAPGSGHLPGAEREARAVAAALARQGVPFDILLGPNGASDADHGWSARPATLANVLHHLVHDEYQLVHYAGHGSFSDTDPGGASGWLLADGLLTGEHLSIVERLPPLVLANACHSSRVSTGLPGLADDFMGRGVRQLVGTAHAVGDNSAGAFSTVFYEHLLTGLGPTASPPTLGRAVLAARRHLHDRGLGDWNVYQLYGDPTFRFWPPDRR